MVAIAGDTGEKDKGNKIDLISFLSIKPINGEEEMNYN